MIAYKVFTPIQGRLYPYCAPVKFSNYKLGYTYLPADDCGPFACFRLKKDAMAWGSRFCDVVYRIRIKQSTEMSVWVEEEAMTYTRLLLDLPPGTILADEFEILEEVK